jgi:hypothetical protein
MRFASATVTTRTSLHRAETWSREKHADAVDGVVVRGREIDLAVAVQITACKEGGHPSGWVVEPPFEIPIPRFTRIEMLFRPPSMFARSG